LGPCHPAAEETAGRNRPDGHGAEKEQGVAEGCRCLGGARDEGAIEHDASRREDLDIKYNFNAGKGRFKKISPSSRSCDEKAFGGVIEPFFFDVAMAA
jgi:hypothetical protein